MSTEVRVCRAHERARAATGRACGFIVASGAGGPVVLLVTWLAPTWQSVALAVWAVVIFLAAYASSEADRALRRLDALGRRLQREERDADG